MKLVELKCKNCGSLLKANSEDKEMTCKYCGTTFKIDDEIKHIKFDDMEQNGYDFEMGRIRAQRESSRTYSRSDEPKKKNNKTLLLILAWLFLFPFMLTYYIWKTDKLTKRNKIIITIVMWILILIISYSNR